MIDNLAIAVTHLLLAIAAWRLLSRSDLDNDPVAVEPVEPPMPPKRGRGARRA